MDWGRLYDDVKECLTRSSFTTFNSVPRRERQNRILQPENMDRSRRYNDDKQGWLTRLSFTKLDRCDAYFAQQNYLYQCTSFLLTVLSFGTFAMNQSLQTIQQRQWMFDMIVIYCTLYKWLSVSAEVAMDFLSQEKIAIYVLPLGEFIFPSKYWSR